MARVAVVVLNWNGWKNTIECLESICRLQPSPNYIVVCDNNSEDHSFEHLQAWADGALVAPSPCQLALQHLSYPPVPKPIPYMVSDGLATSQMPSVSSLPTCLTLIQTGANLGYAGGNNVGIRFALRLGADYVWVLNNDTIVAPGALKAILDTLPAARRRQIGIIGSRVMSYSRPDRIWALRGRIRPIFGSVRIEAHNGGRSSPEHIMLADHVCGCAMLVDSKMIGDIGVMDESFFLYGEETAWMIRARRRGWQVGFVEQSLVWHKDGASSVSRVKDYYSTRNIFHLFRDYYPRHFPIAFPIMLARSVLAKIAWRALRGQRVNATYILLGLLDFLRKRRGQRLYL